MHLRAKMVLKNGEVRTRVYVTETAMQGEKLHALAGKINQQFHLAGRVVHLDPQAL